MAKLNQTFKSSSVEPVSFSRELLPGGEYKAILTDSDMHPNKNKDGTRLDLTFKVIEGPKKNKPVWVGINYDHEDLNTQEMGRGIFSAICRACGKDEVNDTCELHNIPLILKVDTLPAKNGYPAKNIVSEYKPILQNSENETINDPIAADEVPAWQQD